MAHAEQREIHREGVKRIRYMSDNDCIMSCSLDPRRSLVVMDAVRGKNKSYVFSLSKVRTILIISERQRSCGKVMFLHLSVILFTGGASCHFLSLALWSVPGDWLVVHPMVLPRGCGLSHYCPSQGRVPMPWSIQGGGGVKEYIHSQR